jgi:N-acetyl sugar amidotransferase
MKKKLYKVPLNVEFCANCVISNQRPSSTVEFKNKKDTKKQFISFKNSICSACRYNEIKNKIINWKDRESNLYTLLEKFRSKNGEYDVIVPGSGGKDSAFTAHILKYKYNMNPLTVTWAPHLYTEIGWKNFNNWMHIGGLDNVLFTPNGKLHRYLTKISFLNLLHPFLPFILGQRQIGPKFAKLYKVKLVMYGENQAEYGNNINENKNPEMKKDFFSSDFINTKNILIGGESIKKILNSNKQFKIADFHSYLPMESDFSTNIEVHYLGYYLKWDPQECFYYASNNTGFEPNTERTEGTYSKYSSIDDKIDPFHYYTTYIKYGLGRASYDAAQEIRNGKITRQEGVNLVKKYDNEFPKKYFKDFLNYIDIKEEMFWKTIDKFRPAHLWFKKGNTWRIKNEIK